MEKYLVEDLINDLKSLTDEQRQMEIVLWNDELGLFNLPTKLEVCIGAVYSIRGPNNIGWVYKIAVGIR